MKVANAKGRLRGKQPKLNPAQEKHHVELWRAGRHTSAELAELFSVARSTVYRAVQRASEPTPPRPRRTRAATASPSKPRTREHLRGPETLIAEPIVTLHVGSASGVPGLVRCRGLRANSRPAGSAPATRRGQGAGRRSRARTRGAAPRVNRSSTHHRAGRGHRHRWAAARLEVPDRG